MTRTEAYRRVRQTSTPERVVRYRIHEEECPAHGTDDGKTRCRCRKKKRYGYGVELLTHDQTRW